MGVRFCAFFNCDVNRLLRFKHINVFCLLLTLLKVSYNSAQTDYCSGGTSAMDICLDKIGILQKNATGMPTSVEDLDSVCSTFKSGMKCLHDFAITCLKEPKREFFEVHFGPAIGFMKQLCENQTVRQEYLNYPNCHKEMTSEWEKCSKPFVQLVHNQNARDNGQEKVVQICCSKLCFLECIDAASRLKCPPEAAEIHRGLAASLNGSPGSESNCPYLVNSTVCKKTYSRSSRNSFSLIQISLVLTYVLLGLGLK